MDADTSAQHPTIGGVPVVVRPARPVDDPVGRYPGLRPGRTTLRAGTMLRSGAKALPCDITVDRDVEVTLRDRTKIYVDVFRPTDASGVGEGVGDGDDARLPAILAWSPYGKGGGGNQVLDDIPGRAGVPLSAVSELQAWEAPDPAYWCAHGYAVVNADARGAYSSEGDIAQWGTQEGRDGADVVEWIAAQEWCTGAVGMAGNSWLAIVQWFVAAQRPPHLAAIAPWEGMTDAFRDGMPGGFPETGHTEAMRDLMCGGGGVEDMAAMGHRYPTMNGYWQDKAADLAAIEVPAYVVASWTNPAHTRGTFTGFTQIASRQKWLRVHDTQEWQDFYSHADDLRRFFDHYLRGLDNGWETTPRVRLSVLDPSGANVVDRPEQEFPLARAVHRELFLDAATHGLGDQPPRFPSSTAYRADDGEAVFTWTLDDDVEVVGYASLRLWVEARHASDMDLFVKLEAVRHGRARAVPMIALPNAVARRAASLAHAAGLSAVQRIFYTGPTGTLRVSHRERDPQRSTPSQPYLTHRKEQLLSAGDIVEVEIGLAPTGIRWRRGDVLRLSITGANPVPSAGAGMSPAPTRNSGDHVLHTGGRYAARLLLPVVRAAQAQGQVPASAVTSAPFQAGSSGSVAGSRLAPVQASTTLRSPSGDPREIER